MTRIFARLRKFFQPVTLLLLVLVLAFAVGFLAFSEHVTNMREPATVPAADGIIVLTGGQARIETAIGLLQHQNGMRLLISGVHPSTKRQALQRITHADAALFTCCIDIDRSAQDTVGNARESAKWIKAHDYRRVIVVTNNYHMPRSMAELSRAMPDVAFIPYPVVKTDLSQENWIKQGDTLRVLLTEYVKYLRSMARLVISPPAPDTAANASSEK
ncbi:YdcF family protein [Phyllobacterium phragmitis]|uniref:YdcF family protein n=2 Tax=Phyllobacterium phragmitis TaxID=2670329 RepID=A0A2S9IVH1_9HYPH|nr:YdcF family protein [Phyllobacterium phragmitis]